MKLRIWMAVAFGVIILAVFAVALVGNMGTRLDATSPDGISSSSIVVPDGCPPGKFPSFLNGEFRGCYTPGPNFDYNFYLDCFLKLGSAWSAYCLVLADKATGHILYPPALDAWNDYHRPKPITPPVPVPGSGEVQPPPASPVNPDSIAPVEETVSAPADATQDSDRPSSGGPGQYDKDDMSPPMYRPSLLTRVFLFLSGIFSLSR